jgi:hypothetical protein
MPTTLSCGSCLLRRFKLGFVLSIVLACTACGTFQLASNIVSPPGKTDDQRQADILICKDQAEMEANTADRQAGAFLLGATIFGAPVAFELEKSKQREVFSSCMTAQGYAVTIAQDGKVGTSDATAASNPPAMQPSSKLSVRLPAGWGPMPATALIPADTIQKALNRTIGAGMVLSSARRDDLTEVATSASTLRAFQASRLTDSNISDITEIQINGRRAFRYRVAGEVGKTGVKMTYMITFIEGDKEIAILNVWTASANFETNRPELEQLASDVVGF